MRVVLHSLITCENIYCPPSISNFFIGCNLVHQPTTGVQDELISASNGNKKHSLGEVQQMVAIGPEATATVGSRDAVDLPEEEVHGVRKRRSPAQPTLRLALIYFKRFLGYFKCSTAKFCRR